MASPPSSPDLHPPAYLQQPTPPLPPAHPQLELPISALTLLANQTPLQQLHTQSRRLTTILQSHLDAQSLALLSPSSTNVPSIQKTRTHIHLAMRELQQVKIAEAAHHERLADAAAIAKRHRLKALRLQAALAEIDSGGAEVVRLRTELDSVDREIEELRAKMEQLLSRRESLRGKVDAARNSYEARRASYVGALEVVRGKMAVVGIKAGNDSDEEEETRERELAGGAEKEVEALELGMEVWVEVAGCIQGFEEGIRQRMRNGLVGEAERRVVKSEMDSVVNLLERILGRAESEGWKLLVVAIGAELQACREAREILENSLSQEAGAMKNNVSEEKKRAKDEPRSPDKSRDNQLVEYSSSDESTSRFLR